MKVVRSFMVDGCALRWRVALLETRESNSKIDFIGREQATTESCSLAEFMQHFIPVVRR
jgi:hypothetical protein